MNSLEGAVDLAAVQGVCDSVKHVVVQNWQTLRLLPESKWNGNAEQ